MDFQIVGYHKGDESRAGILFYTSKRSRYNGSGGLKSALCTEYVAIIKYGST